MEDMNVIPPGVEKLECFSVNTNKAGPSTLPLTVSDSNPSEVHISTGKIWCDRDLESSDKLTLSKFEEIVGEGLTPMNALVIAHNPSVHVAAEVGYSKAKTQADIKKKSFSEEPHEIESVLHDLEVAKKERNEAREELEKLRRTLQAVDDTPCNEHIFPRGDVKYDTSPGHISGNS